MLYLFALLGLLCNNLFAQHTLIKPYQIDLSQPFDFKGVVVDTMTTRNSFTSLGNASFYGNVGIGGKVVEDVVDNTATPDGTVYNLFRTTAGASSPAAGAEVSGVSGQYNWYVGDNQDFIANGVEGVVRSCGADESMTGRGLYGRVYINPACSGSTMRTSIGGEFSARASYNGGTPIVAESGTAFVGARIWMAPYFTAASTTNINNFHGLWLYNEHPTVPVTNGINIRSAGGGFTNDLNLQNGAVVTNFVDNRLDIGNDGFAPSVSIDLLNSRLSVGKLPTSWSLDVEGNVEFSRSGSANAFFEDFYGQEHYFVSSVTAQTWWWQNSNEDNVFRMGNTIDWVNYYFPLVFEPQTPAYMKMWNNGAIEFGGGNVGIGVANSSEKLFVAGNSSFTGIVTASTFNAVDSAYQLNGITFFDSSGFSGVGTKITGIPTIGVLGLDATLNQIGVDTTTIDDDLISEISARYTVDLAIAVDTTTLQNNIDSEITDRQNLAVAVAADTTTIYAAKFSTTGGILSGNIAIATPISASICLTTSGFSTSACLTKNNFGSIQLQDQDGRGYNILPNGVSEINPALNIIGNGYIALTNDNYATSGFLGHNLGTYLCNNGFGACFIIKDDNSATLSHNLGIGTTVPEALIHLSTTNGDGADLAMFLTAENSGRGINMFRQYSYNFMSMNGSRNLTDFNFASSGNADDKNLIINRPLTFGIWFRQNNSTTEMYISSTGYVGIGTTNPAAKLHLSSGTLLIDGTGAGAQVDGDLLVDTVTTRGQVNMGYEIITNSCGAGVTTCTASCSANKQVTGGGCNTDVSLQGGYPSTSTSWTCNTTAVSTAILDAYVICSRIQ